MAHTGFRRYYFQAPSDTIAPGTSIKLGQLFTDITRPDIALAEPDVIPEAAVSIDHKFNWRWARKNGTSSGITLSAQVLAQFFGLGPIVEAGVSSAGVVECATALLETHEFRPDRDYVLRSMNTAAMSNFLSEHRFASVYMVTGVKIARNPSIRVENETQYTGKLGISWDATPAGAPISGEVSGSQSSSTANTIEYRGSGDIVLGVKINKVVTHWGTANGDTDERLVGTVLDNESRLEDEDEEDGEMGMEIPVGFDRLDEEATAGDAKDTGAEALFMDCVEDDNEGNCTLVRFN